MDSDKNLNGELGGPGWRQRGGQPDSPSEHRDPRFTTFEQDCLDELELESAEDEASSTGTRSDGGSGNPKDDFVDTWSSEQSSPRLWLAFQHTASSISSLYRDHCASATGAGSTFRHFQTAAEACTDMYRESQDVLRVSVEEARKEGRKQLVKDLVMWMKKRGRRGRHFRREELLAFLSGKAPPPPSARPMTTVASGMSSSPGGSLVGPSTHHHPHHPHHRKTNASILSNYCNAADAGTNHHHHHHHHHHRRSLSASPSLTDSNVWVPTDFPTTGYQDGAKNNCDGIAAANINNNNNNNTNNNHSHHPGLFLEPDLRTFRDALAVQGLSGALSNIRVAGSPHSSHGGGGTTPPLLASAPGGASPLRHTASPLDHRVRSSTPSGRQTPAASGRVGGGGGLHQEDLHQFVTDHLTLHGSGGAVGGAGGGTSGENADPLSTSSGYRKRSSSQSGGAHENYAPSAESPTRKRHRLL